MFVWFELIRFVLVFFFEVIQKEEEEEEEDPDNEEGEEDAVQLAEVAAEKMIAAMSIQGFSPVDFPNPALVFHNRVLEVGLFSTFTACEYSIN